MTPVRLPLLVLSPLLFGVLFFGGTLRAQAEAGAETSPPAAEEAKAEPAAEARVVTEAAREKALDLVVRGKALTTEKKAKEADAKSP